MSPDRCSATAAAPQCSPPQAAMALARACADLRANAVPELDLCNKDIGEEDARALAAALEHNGSLTTLYLDVRL